MGKIMGRPKGNPENVRSERVLTNVTPGTLAKINELADKLRMPRSEFLNHLIETGLEDNEFIIKMVSATVLPAQDFLSSLKRKKKKA